MADLVAFYTDNFVEYARLTDSVHGRLEFVRTQELLRRHLPPAPAKVLDVGGATGIHSGWLVEDGHDVTLVDVVPAHVEAAAKIAGLNARVGDARELEETDGSVDAVVMLGPLYHLLERKDRLAAITEGLRVLRPGGLLAAAAVSRYAPILDLSRRGLLSDETAAQAGRIVATGRGVLPDDFVELAYLHSPDGLAEEMVTAGCAEVEVYGLEGPAWPAADNSGDPESEASALRAARLVERDPAIRAASAHLLAVGRAR
ncbi:class I SAM-dependent methyltransferase [Fodinicola acaciae]|uniref:class I SAM-dependent methyltransferase n=1 Tax=Fodinicola acaciae TaxID=2681555 RepID=UPI0013D03610|nr:class I SAM-dependent methyltransferase [Fodinicola acaciae]